MKISSKFRRRLAITALTVAGLVVLAFAWTRSWSRPSAGVRLEFTGYKRHFKVGNDYAEFQLVNNTTNTIQYPLIRNAGPRDTVALWRDGRWKPVQCDPNAIGETLEYHQLKPGRKVTLFVQLTPGGSPKQFAIQCSDLPKVSRSAMSLRLRGWLATVGRRLNIVIFPPEVLDYSDQYVWSREFIAPPLTPTVRATLKR